MRTKESLNRERSFNMSAALEEVSAGLAECPCGRTLFYSHNNFPPLPGLLVAQWLRTRPRSRICRVRSVVYPSPASNDLADRSLED
ncbi:hypothetical protein PoB_002272800 [Plakobranchus ocellatus]|uniref:Uncharacterized protein n=1 Tax=Plakobranchus ocellatus TaxID=259542 RepID=A0AAV3ZNQ2_9GAST|nr:hypothetical protein PoB_002272800 [Plakobranchus ocellatus]